MATDNFSPSVALARNDPHFARSTAGWRLIISPCGTPACVTPRGIFQSPKESLVCIRIFVNFPSVLDHISSYEHF